jgi:hypothetical protein
MAAGSQQTTKPYSATTPSTSVEIDSPLKAANVKPIRPH